MQLDSREIKELEKLKDLFIDEISAINKKGTLTPADGEASKIALEALEKIKCLCCPDDEENMYSERRGRDSMGRYTSRRSYGEMSRHNDTIDSMIDKLEEMKRENR